MFAPLIAALLLLAGCMMAAQAQPLQLEDAFAFSVQREDGALILNWRIAEDYYLYRGEFAAKAEGQSLSLSLPEGERYEGPYFGEGQIYRGEVTARLAHAGQPVTLAWAGLPAGRHLLCPAKRAAGRRWPSAGRCRHQRLGLEPADRGFHGVSGAGLVLAQDEGLVIAGFLGFGLLLVLTPCVFPMFPIVAGMLAGQGESLTARRGLLLTGAYVLAMAAAFGLLGIAAAWSGANFQMAPQSPAVIGLVP